MKKTLETLNKLKSELTFKNLFSIICSYGDLIAAEYKEDEVIKKLTFADYKRITLAGACKLDNILKDVEKNTFVALRCANGPLWPAAFWSIVLAGYRPLLMDAVCSDRQISHVLGQAGSKTLISDTNTGVEGMLCISPEQFLDINAAKTKYTPVFGDAMALCTSGTTSTPKVYVYDEKAICNQVLLGEYICENNKQIIHDGVIKQLAFLPLHHIFGFIAVYMWYTFFGKTIVYIQERTPDIILSACKDHKVTHIYAVPLLWNNVARSILRKAKAQGQDTYNKLINVSELSVKLQRNLGRLGKIIVSKILFRDLQKKLVGSDIQFMISGGGHILPETIKLINAIGYHLVSGFGMTETGIDSVELSNDIDLCLSASVGKSFSPMEYRVACDKDVVKTGELQIRGDAIHSGRMKDGVYIPRDIDKDGWFSSGDIVRQADGHFYIEGRLKDVIINESGENVYPDELEDSFSALPSAEHICVAGIAAEGIYDDTTLFVYMGENASEEEKQELKKEIIRINSLLPIYKKLDKAYLALEPLPLANGIKVKRQKVKEMINSGAVHFEEIIIRKRLKKNVEITKAYARTLQQEPANIELYGIIRRVKEIFGEILDIEPGQIKDTDHFVNDLGGDSLASLGVFSRAEEEYDITISDTEYFMCINVDDLSKLIYKKLREKKENYDDSSVSALEQSEEYED